MSYMTIILGDKGKTDFWHDVWFVDINLPSFFPIFYNAVSEKNTFMGRYGRKEVQLGA